MATSSLQTEHLRDLGVLSAIGDAFYRRLRTLYTAAAGSCSGRPLHNVILTEREVEILSLSIGGHSDRAIAKLLGISDNTVNTHFRRMFRKLGANSRVQAATTAVKLGFLD